MSKRNRKIDLKGVLPDGTKVDGLVIDVSGDGSETVKPPSYRVSPGAWVVACLYGRIAPTPHVAYWPRNKDPRRLTLHPWDQNPIAAYGEVS